MNLPLAAAAVSLCLAVAMWIALVLARWLRHRSMVRRRPATGLALAVFCADGDVDRLGGKLAQLPVEDVIAVTGRALPSLSPTDRAAVGAALASRGMARTIIRRFARADENRRILSCELLGTIGGDDAAAGLRTALKDRATNVRIAAAIALADLGQAPRLVPLLALLGRAARSSSRLVFLFEKLMPRCEAEIVQLVTDEGCEPRLRISALQALGLVRPLTHRALLLQPGHEPRDVAVEVARALRHQHDAEAGAALTGMLAHAAPTVRREAAEAIGRGGFANARPSLVRLTSDPDPAVAAAAARSVWLLRQPSAPDYLAAGQSA